MRSSPDSNSPSDSEPSRKEGRLLSILAGLLLIALSVSLYLGAKVWFTHSELQLLRQELRTTRTSLKAAQLRIEADQVIIQRQLEMLRAAQEPAPKSSP